MNKNSFIFIFVLALMLAFTACDPAKKYKAEIKTLDSLLLALDSVQIKFVSIDTNKINQYKAEVLVNIDSVEKNNKDTVFRENAILLSEYSSLVEKFKKINQQYIGLSKELKVSKEQVSNLVHDLKIGKVDESKVSSCLQEEQSAANNLILSVELISVIAKTNSEKFEIDQPKVVGFINEIKAKQELKK